ncbi:MAG: potassium channel family protein [Desulfococcaceae bacterium]
MKQFAVIGVGKFGHYLAVDLYEKGHDVVAVDRRNDLVQEIRDKVSQAVVADSTDMQALEALGLKEMDAVVVCIGDSSLSNSILTALNVHDIGAPRLLAKAINDSHARILRKIGADEVFFPEKDQAASLAERLHNPSVLDYLPFIEGYSMIQILPPEEFVGKALKDLNLINRYGVQVVAVQEETSGKMRMIPTGDYRLREEDVMIVLGPNDSLEKLRKPEK